MICKEFDSLSIIEKRNVIGELVHAIMNDGECFEMGERLINFGKEKGIFHGVEMQPLPSQEENQNDNN